MPGLDVITHRQLANTGVEAAIDDYLNEGSDRAALGFIDALERAYD